MPTIYAILIPSDHEADAHVVTIDTSRRLLTQEALAPWTRDGYRIADASDAWHGPAVKVWTHPDDSEGLNVRAFRIVGRPVYGPALVTAGVAGDGWASPLPADVAKVCTTTPTPSITIETLATVSEERGDWTAAATLREIIGFPPGGISVTEERTLRNEIERASAEVDRAKKHRRMARTRLAEGLAARDGLSIGDMIEYDSDSKTAHNPPRRKVPHQVVELSPDWIDGYKVKAVPVKKNGEPYNSNPMAIYWPWRKIEAGGQ